MKKYLKDLCWRAAALGDAFYTCPAGAVAVTYHSLSGSGPFAISANAFRDQMMLLFDEGARFLTVSELGSALECGQLSPEWVCVTFDDGFADTLDPLAWFLDRGGRATLFLVGNDSGYNDWSAGESAFRRRKRIPWEEARALAARGVEIGCHSFNHVRLSRLDRAQRHKELACARQRIANSVQAPVQCFAYPYGDYDRRLLQDLRAAGYQWACSAHRYYTSPGTDPRLIPRFEPETRAELADILQGRRHLYYRTLSLAHRLRNYAWRGISAWDGSPIAWSGH